MKKTTTPPKITSKPKKKEGSNTPFYVAGAAALGMGIWYLINKKNKANIDDNQVVIAQNVATTRNGGGSSTPKQTTQATVKTQSSNAIYYYAKYPLPIYKYVTDKLLVWYNSKLLTRLPKGMYVGQYAGEKRGKWVKLKTTFRGTGTFYFWAEDTYLTASSRYDSSKAKPVQIQTQIRVEYNSK